MAHADALSITSFAISLATFLFSMIWSPFQKTRTDEIRLCLDLKRRYTTEMQQYMDTLYTFKKRHGPRYYVRWQSSWHPDMDVDSDERDVNKARNFLAAYWDELLECYETGALPRGSWIPHWVPRGPFWVPMDMLSGKFLRKATDYMELVEPLDCANWYRLGIHDFCGEDRQPNGDYSHANPKRPGRFSQIEKHMERVHRDRWHTKLCKIATACREELSICRPAASL